MADAGADGTVAPVSVTNDGGAASGDAGDPCADQAQWITPQNAARAAVDAGEPPLVCDPLAVQVARNYAAQCMWMHNPQRNAAYQALGGKGPVGENLAGGTPSETVAGAVASWVNEEQWYDHATNTCNAPPNEDCGHYTQLVWKTTTAVGCAKVHCTTGSPFSGAADWDLSVCDYTPAGNIILNGTPESPY